MPQTADVAVIGGGIIGVCTAIYLSQAGHKVVVLEKGRVAGEQSSRNWGWIRQQGRDPDELPIMVEAIGRWKELAKQTNVDFGLKQGGVTYFAVKPKGLQGYEKWSELAAQNGVDSKVLSRSETAKAFPGIGDHVIGALTTSSDMRAEPHLATPALAGIATRSGAQIFENCAVRTLDLEGGRIAGVVTERGYIKTSSVVLAGGAWSSLFLRNHGVNIPQLSVRENVAATQPMPKISEGAAADPSVSFRRRLDGGYTLAPSGVAELFIGPDAFRALPKYLPQLKASPFAVAYRAKAPKGFPDAWNTKRHWSADEITPFEEMRVLNPAVNRRPIEKLAADFGALFPNIGPVELKTTWAGMIDVMPDVVPIVDHCNAIPGLVIGTGMSGHGFGIGPGMGRVLAALVTGDEVGHDLNRFRSTRFGDGSAIQLGPTF